MPCFCLGESALSKLLLRHVDGLACSFLRVESTICDEAARPEGNVHDERDEQRKEIEEVKVFLSCSEMPLIAFGELNSTVDGPNLYVHKQINKGI